MHESHDNSSSMTKTELDKLEDQFFDINRIPGNGVLVFPLSMSRLFAGQDPKTLYDFLCLFDEKIEERTVDIVFIYTNGLYFNNRASSSTLRKKTTAQMLTHKQELANLFKKNKKFPPKSIHFIPWDYLILQAENYLTIQSLLNKLVDSDSTFKALINLESKNNADDCLESQAFIIEETIVTYLIRNKLVQLPNTLCEPDGWRLIFYQGRCLIPDVYLYQNNLLPQVKLDKTKGWFAQLTSSAMYNMKRNILVDYNKVMLNNLETAFEMASAKALSATVTPATNSQFHKGL